MSKKIIVGITLAFLTALISGMANFFAKIAVSKIEPVFFTTIKNVIVFFIIIAFFIFKKNRHQLTVITKRDLPALAAIGIFGGAIPFYLFFSGLTEVPAINAALIHKSLLIWVTILAVPFLKETINYKLLAAIVLLYTSNFVIGGFNGFKFSSGEMMILVATWLWAIENIIAKKTLSRLSPLVISGARMGIGALVLFLIAAFQNRLIPLGTFSPDQWNLIILTSALLFGYVITWYTALQILPVTVTASILVFATLVTNLLSAIFVTGKLQFVDVIQSIMIISATILIITEMKVRAASGKLSL